MKHLIVVGAGIVGLSLSRAAVKAGYRVTLIEQGAIPNPRAASYDQHRMIRYQYGAAEGYTRMVGAAFGAWDRVWADIGVALTHRSGAIAFSAQPGDYADASLGVMRRLGLAHAVLDRDAAERACPQLMLPERMWGVLSPEGGPLYAGRIVEALAQWLTDKPVEQRAQQRVVALDMARACVTLADGATIEGDVLAVCAGAWVGELLPDDPGREHVSRQALCYVTPPAEYAAAWRDGPCIAQLGASGNYTLPPTDGTGLKFGSGEHRRAGKPADGFDADLAEEGPQVLAHFAPFLREAHRYVPLRMQVGYYVRDDSRMFRLEKQGQAVLVTNCDGQMFKFGPLIGERVLACLEGSESFTDLARWAAGR
ncbi:MAG: NAD(P)/FAD-dependent oxidoreductase [Janthinobacterium lividum]